MNGDLSNEKELLTEMTHGDPSAYAAIYEHYHPGVYHFMLRIVKLPDLTEDLVHDVFLKIWEVRSRIDPEQSFTGYLYRIARNHAYKTIRGIASDRGLQGKLLLRVRQVSTVGQEAEWQTKEYERQLFQALSNLSPQRRKVFNLCREEGKTYKETAAILQISSHTVKKHMVLSMRDIYNYITRKGDLMVLLVLVAGIFLDSQVPLSPVFG